MSEIFFVSAFGVTMVCDTRKAVLFWIDHIIDRGGVPIIERVCE